MGQTKAKQPPPLGPLDTPIAPFKNPAAEMALLGCFLIAPETIGQLGTFFIPYDFSDPRLEVWLKALNVTYRPGDIEIDQVLLHENLIRLGRDPLDEGEIQQHELTEHTDTSHAWDYARIVFENAMRRADERYAALVLAEGDTDNTARFQSNIRARRAAFRALVDGEPPDVETPTSDQVMAFPVDVLPKALQSFACEGARAIHCPVDFFGAPMLVALGAAIGNTYCLEIKPGWCERAWLWLGLVASAGSKKSPAIERVMGPLEARQQALRRTYESDLKQWEEADPDRRGKEPTKKQAYTTDATTEALADLLDANARGILLFRDELTGWARGMDQYKNGKGADRSNWLSFWNGGLADISRRGRRQSLSLHKPYVGVMGALPPDMLGDLSDERGREDGFIHRILFAFPEAMLRLYTEDVIAGSTQAGYDQLFDNLWKLTPDMPAPGLETPHVLKFSHEGKRKWVAWITAHYEEQERPDFPTTLHGPWQKLEAYAARFALILHLCRVLCREAKSDDVDEISMAGAGKLVDYFKSHARRVYARLYATPEDKQVLAAIDWIKRQPNQTTHHRDIQRSGIPGVATADDARSLLKKLEERGYGTAKETTERGGKRLTFTLKQNPTVDRNARGQEWSAA